MRATVPGNPVAGLTHRGFLGDSVNAKEFFTASTAVSRPRLCLVAAAVLVVLTGSSVLAAAEQSSPAPYLPGPDNCLLVKNQEARKICQSAREEYYKGNYRGALAEMKKALELSPQGGVIRVLLASILLRYEAFGPAERELRQARKDGAPDHMALPQLFFVMVQRHEENNLLTEFPEPPPGAKGEGAADIFKGRASALLSLDRVPEAAAALDHALAIGRDAASVRLRSDIALKQKDMALADKLADEAYRLDPKNGANIVTKLQQLDRAGDTAAVLALSDRMIALYPINTDPRVFKIDIFLKRNQDAKAQAEVNAILAKRSKSPVGLYYSAVLKSRAKDKKGAVEIIQSLPSQFVRDHPEYGRQMAQIAFDNGNTELGASILGAALSAAPDILDLRLQLASLRLNQNAPQAALLALAPVQESRDPRVQKLLKDVRARIAKDRSF